MPGLKEFAGGAKRTTLNVDIAATTTTFDVVNAIGYPDGVTAPFVIAIGLGTASEEKILVASRTGNTFTVATGGRGYDGTTAAAHNRPASVDHVLDADTVREVNQFVNGGASAAYVAKAGVQFQAVAATESTTSATYVDLTTVGPSVTVNVGAAGRLLILLAATAYNSTANGSNPVSVALSGANTLAAADTHAVVFASPNTTLGFAQTEFLILTGLAAGSTTVTVKYRAGGGTSTYSQRRVAAFSV